MRSPLLERPCAVPVMRDLFANERALREPNTVRQMKALCRRCSELEECRLRVIQPDLDIFGVAAAMLASERRAACRQP